MSSALREAIKDLQQERDALMRTREEVRREIFALCEDTEERCGEQGNDTRNEAGAFARGRLWEAASIRNAMGEVIRLMIEREQARQDTFAAPPTC